MLNKKINFNLLVICHLSFVISFIGCSRRRLMESGDYYFRKGIYPQAIRYYEKHLAQAGNASEKFEAWTAIAASWAKLGNCAKSLEYYEMAGRHDPFGPQQDRIRRETLSCADYFPLEDGDSRQEADSQTLGRNMFAVSETEKRPGSYLVRRKIYAGQGSKRLVHEAIFIYSKEPGMVWERLAGASAGGGSSSQAGQREGASLLLRYPYEKGAWWTTRRRGRLVKRSITQDHLIVTAAAGRFDECIEVAEETNEDNINEANEANKANKAKTYEIYCSGIGRVKSFVGTGSRKEPHSELLKRE
ncbi:MAG: tetratricopeptide repeat protein [Elusimicrobia bacterium]|nr:tetratricopeptide repeat protein [Elusimicrobiota bacterium]